MSAIWLGLDINKGFSKGPALWWVFLSCQDAFFQSTWASSHDSTVSLCESYLGGTGNQSWRAVLLSPGDDLDGLQPRRDPAGWRGYRKWMGAPMLTRDLRYRCQP